MRTSVVVASFGAALVALAAGVAPGRAEAAAQLYPYCALRSGSTSCYHLTLESCGRSCSRNPAYVGDDRARVLRAALGAPAPTRTASQAAGSSAAARRAQSNDSVAQKIEPGARASSATGADFAGYPTSYLVNRF